MKERIIIPEPWATAMFEAGHVDPRTDVPSIRALSRHTGIHALTLTGIIDGTTMDPRIGTVRKIARELDHSQATITQWINNHPNRKATA